ncbi:hypothetical protein TanjilG_10581 [Lupinus angustifolius]|uniref:Cytochrome P450 n=1 Tax=Lupinus angustifolius TaxID=3871 RepID=A0A4P1RVY9_LUPAN|nr:PREDICTED: cytochrome P450 71A1-like [Lupinus angustifolius]OIW19020.1 hypothetical protein TanjilG_10581 [Lupinus angustifolius]
MVSIVIFLLCLSIPLLLLLLFQKPRSTKNPCPPPGPRGLPIIGNLHQLNDSSTLHLQLWQLSKKYGPLFSLQLGLRPAIVVSSPKLAKEILKNHGLVFSGRPSLYGQQKLSYNGSEIVFSPYSDYWREIRKVCVLHIFSSKRVSSFSSIRHYEVKQMMKKISSHASSSTVTNLSELLMSLSSSIICRIAFGRKYEDEGTEKSRFHKMLNEVQAMLGTIFVSDFIPFMGWIDKLIGLHSRLDRIYKEMDKFFQQVIDEHMDQNREHAHDEDIVDVLLQLKKQRSFSTDLTYDHVKAVLLDILVAATDTTAATSVWAMTALIKKPNVMKKAHDEIRKFGGKKNFLEENDIQNLPYLKAVIKETLRLYLPAPLLVPREANENCIIDGYQIKAKTIVYVNAWAIHRDPEAWKDPQEFYPERFLDNAIDFQGQDFELIPFGAGRRICPGLSMATPTLELIIANLLYSFDWELPQGLVKEDIDTEVLPGITLHKKNPLCLFAKNHI